MIWSANQWTDFYVIDPSVMKELKRGVKSCIKEQKKNSGMEWSMERLSIISITTPTGDSEPCQTSKMKLLAKSG